MAGWHVTEGTAGSVIWDGDKPIGTVNHDAAHRMAAAPDMLEALEAILRQYERLMVRAHVESSAYFRGFSSGARAAIAKAKGEGCE